jgi:hypothetical protein
MLKRVDGWEGHGDGLKPKPKHDIHKSVTGKTFVFDFDHPMLKKLDELTKAEGREYLSQFSMEQLEEPIIQSTAYVDEISRLIDIGIEPIEAKWWLEKDDPREALEKHYIKFHHRKIDSDDIEILFFLRRCDSVEQGYKFIKRYSTEDLINALLATERYTGNEFYLRHRTVLEKHMVELYVKGRLEAERQKRFVEEMLKESAARREAKGY